MVARLLGTVRVQGIARNGRTGGTTSAPASAQASAATSAPAPAGSASPSAPRRRPRRSRDPAALQLDRGDPRGCRGRSVPTAPRPHRAPVRSPAALAVHGETLEVVLNDDGKPRISSFTARPIPAPPSVGPVLEGAGGRARARPGRHRGGLPRRVRDLRRPRLLRGPHGRGPPHDAGGWGRAPDREQPGRLAHRGGHARREPHRARLPGQPSDERGLGERGVARGRRRGAGAALGGRERRDVAVVRDARRRPSWRLRSTRAPR